MMKSYLVRRISKNIEKKTSGKVRFIYDQGDVILQYGEGRTKSCVFGAWEFIFDNLSFLI